MWTPDFSLRPGIALCLLILITHGAAVFAIGQLGGMAWALLPLVAGSGIYYGLRDGLLLLPGSIVQVWLDDEGWHCRQRSGQIQGPFLVHSLTRTDSHFIRLSFARSGRWPRHLLLSAGTLGADAFRQLQVFLRWAADRNQPPT